MLDIDTLKLVADFFSKILGSSTEILIHDMQTKQIIWIENGWISNRKAGQLYDTDTIQTLAKEAKESGNPNMQVGYKSTLYFSEGISGSKERPLRSSNLFLYDEKEELRYVIGVNTDISVVKQFQTGVENLLAMAGLNPSGIPDESGESRFESETPPSDSIEAITMRVILDEIEHAKPFSTDSKEAKMTILRRLNERGVFEVRYTIPKVCELLDLAQATLYKYLKEIKDSNQTL